MFRILLAGSALALATPAMAQQTGSATPDATMPQSGADTSASTPAGSTPAPADAQAGAQQQAGASQVATIVNSEFPVYDADKSGQLDQVEFSKWILALKDQEMKATGKTMAQEELTAWASSAFTTADADKNSSVSKTEFTTYLGG